MAKIGPQRSAMLFNSCVKISIVACRRGARDSQTAPPRMNRHLERLDAILEDANPRVVLTTEGVFRQLQSQIGKSPQLAKLDWVITEQVPLNYADGWADPKVNSDAVAFLQYTSASTS